MSVVTVQVGQCGNQLGHQLFSTLLQEAQHGADATQAAIADTFFREPGCSQRLGLPVARAVLVDTEDKVVSRVLRSAENTGRWSYDASRCTSRQSGAANNWANGYMKQGPVVRDAVCDGLRREAEACDSMQVRGGQWRAVAGSGGQWQAVVGSGGAGGEGD